MTSIAAEQEPTVTAVDPDLLAGLDPGMDNLATLTRKQTGLCSRYC